jgi:hypothetical protein
MNNKHVTRFNELNDINPKTATREMKQERGRQFEELLNDIFESEEIIKKRGYHTKDNKSEQIDGAIEVFNRIFLIEVKWVTSGLAASNLFAFIGKTDNKFHGTLGVFISRTKLKNNFINALNKGRRQSVIAIHGEDIDLIFSEKVVLKDYIEYAFKELSIDNLVHVPIKKFLQIIESEKSRKLLIEEVDNTNNKAISFLKNDLFNTHISMNNLVVKLAGLKKEEKDTLYNTIIKDYDVFWYSNLTGDKTFILDNMNNFLKYYKPNDDVLKKEAVIYYSDLLRKSLKLYTQPIFVNTFSEFYVSTSKEVKNKFENFILDKWKTSFGDYDAENRITDLLKPIWKDLSLNLKNELNKGYLDIYMSTRTNKHSQKKYASELISMELIPDSIIKEWLLEKIASSTNAYMNLTDEKITFIAASYKDILKLVEPNSDNWINYIQQELNKITIEQPIYSTNNKIIVNSEQTIQFVRIEGLNKLNLLISNIILKVSHFKNDGSTNSQQYSLTNLFDNPAYEKDNTNIKCDFKVSNKGYDKTELLFENLESNQINLTYRLINN